MLSTVSNFSKIDYSSFGQKFWETTDFKGIEQGLRSIHQSDGDKADVFYSDNMVKGKVKGHGLTLLSQSVGNARIKEVFDCAKGFGRRAGVVDDVDKACSTLRFDFKTLVDDLVTLKLRRDGNPMLLSEDVEKLRASAGSVLKALLLCQQMNKIVEEQNDINLNGGGLSEDNTRNLIELKLSLMNAALGCLKMIDNGQVTNESVFELVDTEVYDITKAADVLKIAVKTAHAARDKFVGEAEINKIVKDLKDSLSGNCKEEDAKELGDLAQKLISHRKKLVESLDVQFSLGDGAKKHLEGKIKEVREKLRAFRYDLDMMKCTELTEKEIGRSEKFRRFMDNLGSGSSGRLTVEQFREMAKVEEELNKKIASLSSRSPRRENSPKINSAFTREKFDEVTKMTHLANDGIRYYFSKKEQKLEDYRVSVLKTMEEDLKNGGSRELDFEIGLAIKFGIPEAVEMKLGGAKTCRVKVSVAKGGGAVTIENLSGWKGKAGFSVGFDITKGSVSESHKVSAKIKVDVNAQTMSGKSQTFATAEDFIAALKGKTGVMTRTGTTSSACLGRIGELFCLAGKKILNGLTNVGLRIHKSKLDNAEYLANLHKMGILGKCDHFLTHLKNPIVTAESEKGVKTVNDAFDLNVGAKGFLSGGAGISGTTENIHQGKVTYRRTFLDAAKMQSDSWLQANSKNWLNQFAKGDIAAGNGKNSKSIEIDIHAALRSIDEKLKDVEDETALAENKEEVVWIRYASVIASLSIYLAAIQREHPELDTSYLEGRLKHPGVKFKDKTQSESFQKEMKELMCDIFTTEGVDSTKVTVSKSVQLNLSLGLDSLSNKLGLKVNDVISSNSGSSEFLKGVGVVAGRETAILSGAASHAVVDSILPTNLHFEYTTETENTVTQTSFCPWQNVKNKVTTTYKVSPSLSVRALMNIIVNKKLTDLKDDDGDPGSNVFKPTLENETKDALSAVFANAISSTVKNGLDLGKLTVGELFSSSAPNLPEWKGFEAYQSMDKSLIEISLTKEAGRTTEISLQASEKCGGNLELPASVVEFSIGDTLKTNTVVNTSMVSPSADSFMAKYAQTIPDEEAFHSIVQKNAEGFKRLCYVVTSTVKEGLPIELKDDPNFESDKKSFDKCLSDVKTALQHIKDKTQEHAMRKNEAGEILGRLEKNIKILQTLGSSVGNDVVEYTVDHSKAMEEIIKCMTNGFLMAKSAGFMRDPEGNLVRPGHLRLAD